MTAGAIARLPHGGVDRMSLTDADRDHVLSVIASARNEWVRATAALVSQRIASTEDDADPLPELTGLDDEPRTD
jgi:hypothetical protein